MLDFFKPGGNLIGSTLRSRTSKMKAEILTDLEKQLWPAFAAGDSKVQIHQSLPLPEAEASHAILRGNRNTGKVVLLAEA